MPAIGQLRANSTRSDSASRRAAIGTQRRFTFILERACFFDFRFAITMVKNPVTFDKYPPSEMKSRQHTFMEDAENLHTVIGRSIENAVRFYRIVKIVINIGVEAPTQFRIGCQLFERPLNVVNILLGTHKAKLFNTVRKNIFQITVRLFVNVKDRIIRHRASFSSWKRSLRRSNSQRLGYLRLL